MNETTMNPETTPEGQEKMTTTPAETALSRRSMLRTVGMVAATGGFLAACGDPIDESPTRIGKAPTPSTLPPGEVDDVVLLRTAMSMEYLVHDILASAPVSGAFTMSPSPTGVFVPAHKRSIAVLSGLVAARDGAPYDKANPKLMSVFGDDAISLVATSDQRDTDAHALALALETLLASTYQDFVTHTADPALRSGMSRLGARAARNSALAAQMIRGGVAAFAPATDESGVALVSTLPTAFGPLSNVQVFLGKPNDTGARTQVTMDTPSLNSYIYSYMQ